MFDELPDDFGIFPGGQQEWEPGDGETFADQDPLNPNRRVWGENLRRSYNAKFEFAAWGRLPPLLRAQSWRERELTDFIRTECFRQAWDTQTSLGELTHMSVGRRSWETVGPPGIGIAASQSRWPTRYREAVCAGQISEALAAFDDLDPTKRQLLQWHPLAIVLSFRSLSELGTLPYASLHLDRIQFIKSHIYPLEEYGLQEAVPLVLEESRDYRLRSSMPAGSVLQGGQRIYTITNSGLPIPGTLTAIVEYRWQGITYDGLLGPQHVLQNVGESVYQNGTKIGEVVCSDTTVDVALAEITGSTSPRPEILNRNLHPSLPISPVSGMPAEYYGSTSQTIEESYIGLVYISPPSFYKYGYTPVFEIEGISDDGDSGAIILSGHNQQDATSPDITRHAPGLQGDQLSAILGMLVAGANSTNLCDKPATILATPANDIQAALDKQGFKIQWLTR